MEYQVIYALFFHPLAKYPGPLLGKLTTLYAAYHAWKGDLHLDIWRCHERYGICLLSSDKTSPGTNFTLLFAQVTVYDTCQIQ